MKSSEVLQIEPGLKQAIADELHRDPALIPAGGVDFGLASTEYAEPMANLYKRAYARGDYFAGRYDRPGEQIFNPEWLARDLQDPSHIRFVFTDSNQQLLGATAFFRDSDSEAGPLMTSDATQIDHNGRGMRIMDSFFKRIVPVIEASGAGLATDFVLTPESKGLRRTLQTDLGMVAIGIHPHALRHRELGITRSEISAVKYYELTPKQVQILPFFEPLYRIVRSQLPALPEPKIVGTMPQIRESTFIDYESEIVESVSASDTDGQSKALETGYLPVAFDPDGNQFKVAQYPRRSPDLDFISANEQVPANKHLVKYLSAVLFATYGPVNQERRQS